MGYRMISGRAYQVGNIGGFDIKNTPKKSISKENNFKDVLSNEIDKKNGFTVSKHAAERLSEINLSEKDMREIEKGFELAQNKGSKNSLMLYKDIALVTSIENKTVITAVDKNRATDNVFTNIDSVVIL